MEIADTQQYTSCREWLNDSIRICFCVKSSRYGYNSSTFNFVSNILQKMLQAHFTFNSNHSYTQQ